eukprot:Selendium_serpulae@DN6445_c1_g3_i2.p2
MTNNQLTLVAAEEEFFSPQSEEWATPSSSPIRVSKRKRAPSPSPGASKKLKGDKAAEETRPKSTNKRSRPADGGDKEQPPATRVVRKSRRIGSARAVSVVQEEKEIKL